ncbi:DEAD/DEAH box helicase [Sulfitobacter sp. S190]|uniref:DEAD/DEAH box helicase n=1 Tax=Sulfitobacter sp. S190 TaxID=2867022 RepID=UPI0021A50ED9|nr:DEAD/DEAH box helicase [Sulfitobacter sp. S190]UWR21612.1 DEAD/DEAH box helicase [Sulfitobacter sp. S190]
MQTTHLSQRDQELLFGSETAKPGDAVVHFKHGLAEYRGEENCTIGDVEQTLVSLRYRNGGKLLLPAVENEDFWLYGASAGAVNLDRLKSGDWTKRRDQMVDEVNKSADAVIAQDKERRATKARKITPSADAMKAFAESFAFDETEDQLATIDAVLADMAREVPMKRLLIGDVGFGKTEVAIRAAAAAVLSGHQVVMVAPTTVLARQHFEEMQDRFKDIATDVIEVSRSTTAQDMQDLSGKVKAGHAQIIVGTHSVLTADLEFDKLALVVIDEEQKFGERQKADLETLASGAHVLTMTATPIPRSLAAAEVGLLDISVIATAPKDRLPIETEVTATDLDMMLKAIDRELARDGQCYVVCPRVAGIDRLAGKLDRMDIPFDYAIAHGQMPDDDMEASMLRFMRGEVQVLLSTSIVESGLDNTNANTMIVFDAELFGLAQLHQLRGRIGRSKLPAHMILFSDIDLGDDSEAATRLTAFAQMSELGAGFRIARKDRDIRGFGTLDGPEQSGQHSRLGIGLYRHVLKQHVARS